MAGSRANWEAMVSELRKGDIEKAAEKKVKEVLETKPKQTVPPLGSGMAAKGAGIIQEYRARQKKAMDEY